MKSHRLLAAALLLCSFAACGQTPTGSDPQAQPAGASFDGGYTMGSGNSYTASGGYTIGSGGRQEEEDGGGFTIGSGGMMTESDSTNETERGGYTMGSGN
jgi:hypothetical protein